MERRQETRTTTPNLREDGLLEARRGIADEHQLEQEDRERALETKTLSKDALLGLMSKIYSGRNSVRTAIESVQGNIPLLKEALEAYDALSDEIRGDEKRNDRSLVQSPQKGSELFGRLASRDFAFSERNDRDWELVARMIQTTANTFEA